MILSEVLKTANIMGELKHKFRMLLMNDGEDFGEEILVSMLEEKCAEIAEQYAKDKIKRIIYDNDLIMKLRKTHSNAESRRLIMSKL